MSTSVGMTRTGKVTGKSAARHNDIKLVLARDMQKVANPCYKFIVNTRFNVLIQNAWLIAN